MGWDVEGVLERCERARGYEGSTRHVSSRQGSMMRLMGAEMLEQFDTMQTLRWKLHFHVLNSLLLLHFTRLSPTHNPYPEGSK